MCGERGSQPVSSHSPLQLQSITSSLSSCSPAHAHKHSDIQSHDLSTLFLLPLNMKIVYCTSNLDPHLQQGRAPPLPRACAVPVINAGSRGWHWPGGQSQEPGVRDITTPQHTTHYQDTATPGRSGEHGNVNHHNDNKSHFQTLLSNWGPQTGRSHVTLSQTSPPDRPQVEICQPVPV